ncbi:MAG TPA: 3-methyl-2-oxobutanoate hydroxymethyltransferase [Aestuariivirga sp.]
MTRKRPTVADVRAMKGKYQYTMLRVETMQEAEAAELAGIDMASVPPDLMCDPEFRDAAPGLFAVPGLNYFDVGTTDDFIRWSFRMIRASADAVYCSASLQTVRRLADEAIPVIGHVGLVPSKRTWTGGFKAVGKSAESAIQIFNAVKAYESAGAFGAEIEVVPSEVAREISKRTALFMVSMGAGTGCDAQYLFAEDVLGSNTGHYPRHAKRYRDFAADYARLQKERIAAFTEFARDVETGAYPTASHEVGISLEEMQAFKKLLSSAGT